MKKVVKNNRMIVDLTNITLDDVYKAFAVAKFNTMRKEQRDAIAAISVDRFFAEMQRTIDNALADIDVHYSCDKGCECKRAETKKPNVFKRFWNWITRK